MIRAFKLLFLILMTASCVQDAAKSRPKKSTLANTQGATVPTTSQNPTFQSGGSLFWFSSGTVIDGTITINQNINTVIYLRGSSIHNFLAEKTAINSKKKYCMVMSFNGPSTKKHLRVAAIPIIQNNTNTNVLERLFRIDLAPNFVEGNKSVCDGDLPLVNSRGITTETVNSGVTDNAFIPFDICQGCTSVISSTNISMYSENLDSTGAPLPITILNKVPNFSLNFSTLGFRMDLVASSSQTGFVCSNSNCTAKGFSCCLEGQCVNDGELKPNAASSTDYNQALADVANDLNRFINWPQIYYVCPNIIHVPKKTTDDVNEGEEAEARFDFLFSQYQCLQEGKKESPNFEVTNVCEPGNETQTRTERHDEIRKEIWSRCGCKATPFPDKPDEPFCPDFSLKAIIDQTGKILNIVCDTPPQDQEPKPFQDLRINVPGTTAPHRFFRSTSGESIDDISTVTKEIPLPVPEGDEFFYLDKIGKSNPQNHTLNMNSILGQFYVTLPGAKPATTLDIEFDQQYIIQAISGFFTPCPSCSSDAWFDSFTAFPPSEKGVGLKATGYNTVRDGNIGFNNTRGNYEDTIFGRACWIPPTMIPFSHRPQANILNQRRHRLKTQAALFSNGYQRDWFGFNKGALIGSFDGVSWFAIGTGRRVTSTSTKLFLAINQAFADLSDNSPITVQVIQDLGNNVVPDMDFDPDLSNKDARQNRAASCQSYHLCTNDLDCVTRLGWEYMCSDVTKYKTSWPRFNSFANEVGNSEIESATFSNILNGFLPIGGAKRCVYRGAGSPCKINFTTGFRDKKVEKLWSCAPNFYCANLNSASFNDQVSREPLVSSNILLGQGAKVLGRPEKYISGGKVLPIEIKDNILHSAKNITEVVSDWGICRPGRKIVDGKPSDPILQSHQAGDTEQRADYISQIANCPSVKNGIERVQTCPVFDMDELNPLDKTEKNKEFGNFVFDDSNKVSLRSHQNTCGRPSAHYNTGLSPFRDIEARPLAKLLTLSNKTLVADACLRKPGAVCHTNLDCSPNTLHAEQALIFDVAHFGRTNAEHQYWQENLICGQSTIRPLPGNELFDDFDLTKNRCCREITKTFTMHTQYTKVNELYPNLIPDQDEEDSKFLKTYLTPLDDPKAVGRYSRYNTAELYKDYTSLTIDPRTLPDNDETKPFNQAPIIEAMWDGFKYNGVTPKMFQWKTMNQAGRNLCCGKGFIRKFSDGTHDWRISGRLMIDFSKFKCLNFQTLLVDEETLFNLPKVDERTRVTSGNYDTDSDSLCLAPGDQGTDSEGGCAQVAIERSSGFNIVLPSERLDSHDEATLDTTPEEDPSQGEIKQIKTLSNRVIYLPTPYVTRALASNDLDAPLNFMLLPDAPATIWYYPIFMGGRSKSCAKGSSGNPTSCFPNIIDVHIRYMEGDTQKLRVKATPMSTTYCKDDMDEANGGISLIDSPDAIINAHTDQKNRYCIFTDSKNRDVILINAGDESDEVVDATFAGVEIKFKVPETKNDPNLPVDYPFPMTPGNDLYYLSKLARLELLGIPQIFYEPLYCNNYKDNLVDGIFELGEPKRQSFDDNSFEWDNTVNGKVLTQIYDQDVKEVTDFSNPNDSVVFQDKISLPKIFHPHEFVCCSALLEEVQSGDKCCSNFSENDEAGKQVCKLPYGTNLHVYFNRFVSGEGVGNDLPLGGLKDTDFIPETGEPRYTSAVQDKISELGKKFCASGGKAAGVVRKGGAFGDFLGEPNTGFFKQNETDQSFSAIYGIVDSLKDTDVDNNAGYTPFLAGFKWNNHLYCDLPE